MINSDTLIDRLVHFRQLSFIRIIQRTMLTLFPIILIGSVAEIISSIFLSPAGFLGSTLHVRRWLTGYQFWRNLFNDVSVVTLGFTAPYAAYISAQLTTRQRKGEIPAVGVSAMACYVLIFYHSFRQNGSIIDMRYYTANWFIVGVLVGYLVGLLFGFFGKKISLNKLHLRSNDILQSAFANFIPILLTLTSAFLVHLAYAVIRQLGVDEDINQYILEILNSHSNYALTMLISLLATILTWLGFAESINISNEMFRSEIFVNLNYALTHKTNLNVPYPFTPAALYNGFGRFGGVGLGLALLIAIIWVNHHRNQRAVAKASLLPVFFNANLPLTMGAVVILNPIYVLPFVLLPLFNMVVASGLIMLKLLPPLVYPAPVGTPGILVPLIGTGGDWFALFWSILLLVVDVIAYIPFVKLADQVESRLIEERAGGRTHAKN
ncbi:PTS transporter subunit EIIC [Limosilactobacillus sp.]|uniref:PTS transporter subunit EIIC n=1 Tax=Limosilactobacillus sp. TaxID=2773925 RepID=UPI003F03E5B2